MSFTVACAISGLRRCSRAWPLEGDLDMLALVSRRQDKGFFESVTWVAERFAPHLLREFDRKWLLIEEPWKVALRVMGRLKVR